MTETDRAQAESVGTVLLVGVVVVLVGLVGAFTLSGNQEAQPLADVQVTADADNVTLTHEGGDELAREKLRVTIQTDSGSERYEVPAANLSGSDDTFELGDTITLGHDAGGESARVLLVHTPTNTVVAESRVDLNVATGTALDPAAAFTVSPRNPSVGESTTFDADGSSDPDGTVVSFAWDFDGDGTTDATGARVTHTYSSTGTYTASVTVTDDDGRTATDSKTMTVTAAGNPPSASFTYSPSNPSTGETVSFDGSGSSDSDGTVTSYEWDFDGDGTTDATGQTTSKSFSGDGNYDVTLTVTDDSGATESVTKTVTVSNDAPTASFNYSPSNPDTQDTLSFTASASDSDGTVDSYAWDFGDGTTASGSSPSHSYSDDGSYTVTLTVTDDDGATTTVTETVDVANVAPTAEFTYSPSTVHTGEDVTFDGGASSDVDGTVTSYEWDFEDGSTATGETATHAFDSPGRYDVTLTVTDDDGATATRTKTVEVGGLQYTGGRITFDWSQSGTESGVGLGLENNATEPTTVTAVTVTSDTAADTLNNLVRFSYYPEIYVTADQNGARYGNLALGQRHALGSQAVVNSDSTGALYFLEFATQRGQSSNYDPVEMRGATVTVTVEYEYDTDGTTASTSFTTTLPN